MSSQVEQIQQDINFIRVFINGNTRFTTLQKTTLTGILRRSDQREERRGGLTKQDPLDLTPLLSGENVIQRGSLSCSTYHTMVPTSEGF